MSIGKALKRRLYDDNEPLAKRLKIGRNALFTNSIYIPKKENIVIKWFCDHMSKESAVSTVLLECLSTDYMKQLNTSNIGENTRTDLVQALCDQLENETRTGSLQNIIDSAILILQSPSFQYFFKNNMEVYVKLIGLLLKYIEQDSELKQIMQNLLAYNKVISNKSKFALLFVNELLPGIGDVQQNIINADLKVSTVVRQILFPAASRDRIEEYLTQLLENKLNIEIDIQSAIFLSIFNKQSELVNSVNLESVKYIFRTMCASFLQLFKSDHTIILQYFLIISKVIGFNLTDLDVINLEINKYYSLKSIPIMQEILACFVNLKIDFKVEWQDKTFSNYMQTLIHKACKLSKISTSEIFKLLNIIMKLSPDIFEENLNDILVYCLNQHKTEEFMIENNVFMIGLFDMFSKLHREHKLVSVILKLLNELLGPQEGAYRKIDITTLRVEDILTPTLLSHFSEMISNLPSKQTIAIYRTLVHHLNNDVVEVLETKNCDAALKLLVGVEAELTIHFMQAITMADDNIPKVALNRFIACMDDFKQLLSRFGIKLLNMIHQCDMMYTFLQMCYTWAELYLLFIHYIPYNIESFERIVPVDSECTYLHDYLTDDQWKTFDQRIANFGETRCKLLMQKLSVQRERILFYVDKNMKENRIKEETVIICDIFDKLLSHVSMDDMKEEGVDKVAEMIMKYIVTHKKFDILENNRIQENRLLLESLIATCFIKLNKELKLQKKQSNEGTPVNLLTRKVLRLIDVNLFKQKTKSSEKNKVIADIVHLIDENVSSEQSIALQEKNIILYLKVLQNLPLSGCSELIKIIIILVLYSLHMDDPNNADISTYCEQITLNVVQTKNPGSMVQYTDFQKLLKMVVSYKRYEVFLEIIINSFVHNNSLRSQLVASINEIKNLVSPTQYGQVVTILFNSLLRKQIKIEKLSKDKQLRKPTYKLAKMIHQIVLEQTYEEIDIIYGYQLAIQRCLIRDKKNILPGLLEKFPQFLNYALDNIQLDPKICAEFINFTLKNKAKLQKHVPEDFLVRCNSVYQQSDLIAYKIVLQKINNEDFKTIVSTLMNEMKIDFQSENYDNMQRHVNTFSIVMSCKFNVAKTAVRQEILTELLIEVHLSLSKTSNKISLSKITLNFIITLTKSLQVELSPSILDTIIIILLDVQYPKELNDTNIDLFISLYTTVISTTKDLLLHRTKLVLGRIHNILVVYRRLLKTLCEKSTVKAKFNYEEELSKCAHAFQKLNGSLINYKKHMTRLAPYLIADILQFYETITIYPVVKTYINSCLYSLIPICDIHVNPYLHRVLSPASQEMYKFICDNYTKYHRFTGRS